jgi:hypothetical protein
MSEDKLSYLSIPSASVDLFLGLTLLRGFMILRDHSTSSRMSVMRTSKRTRIAEAYSGKDLNRERCDGRDDAVETLGRDCGN